MLIFFKNVEIRRRKLICIVTESNIIFVMGGFCPHSNSLAMTKQYSHRVPVQVSAFHSFFILTKKKKKFFSFPYVSHKIF